MDFYRPGRFPRRTFTRLFILLAISTIPILSAFAQELPKKRLYQPNQVLEITQPESSRPPTNYPVTKGNRLQTLIYRAQLKIISAPAAEGITAVDIWADAEDDKITVRLSIIYNDLSNPEWWKDKRENIIGNVVVPMGETLRPAELLQFGLEPFQLRFYSPKEVVLRPGKDFPIINHTTSLEVVRLEKVMDRYSLLLKNTSTKKVVAYVIGRESGSLGVNNTVYPGSAPLIEPGSMRWEEHLAGNGIEKGLTIAGVVFEDGSYEGDEKFATNCIVRGMGMSLQARQFAQMLQQLLQAPDADMGAAYKKFQEARLNMSEAIDKSAAITLLKEKYPHLDEGELNSLYEILKAGLYDARYRASAPAQHFTQPAGDGQRYRVMLEYLLKEYQQMAGK